MDENEFNLAVETKGIDYIIPAKEIGIEKVAKVLEVDKKDLEEIEIEINISKTDKEIPRQIEKNAKENKYEVVFPPVDFEVIAKTKSTKGEKREIKIGKFKQYVKRVLEIPKGVDPDNITTGIVYNKDGTFSHIPTDVFKEDGVYYAKLNSLTNSSYSVIWNPIKVASVEDHWSKEYVNDMVSRLVVKNPDTFSPNGAITRAEFAEYITKVTGVYRTEVAKERQFTDVSTEDEYADAITIAVEYGIIKGYEDGSFKPNTKITREEAMTMYSRAMDIVKLEEIDKGRIENYKDKGNVADWAYEDVKKTIGARSI